MADQSLLARAGLDPATARSMLADALTAPMTASFISSTASPSPSSSTMGG